MHIHAQTQVERDGTVVHVSSGSDQHAAITNSITTSITNYSPPSSKFGAIGMGVMSPSRVCLELSGWGSRALRVHVWSYRDGGNTWFCWTRATKAARSGQPDRPGRPERPARAARAASQGGQSGLRRRIWAKMCISLMFPMFSGSERKRDPSS